MFFAPESPWWLVRQGREAEALRSVERLGRRSNTQNMETVAMIRRVVELEKSETAPSYTELFKGSDLRLTLIVTRLSTFLSVRLRIFKVSWNAGADFSILM